MKWLKLGSPLALGHRRPCSGSPTRITLPHVAPNKWTNPPHQQTFIPTHKKYDWVCDIKCYAIYKNNKNNINNDTQIINLRLPFISEALLSLLSKAQTFFCLCKTMKEAPFSLSLFWTFWASAVSIVVSESEYWVGGFWVLLQQAVGRAGGGHCAHLFSLVSNMDGMMIKVLLARSILLSLGVEKRVSEQCPLLLGGGSNTMTIERRRRRRKVLSRRSITEHSHGTVV